jgi:hypothetical protein
VNVFAIQHNPSHFGDEVGPFIAWPFQEKAARAILNCMVRRRDLRWQKSREVGASWLALMLIVWLCLFHQNKKMLVISRDEKSVDRPEDSDSLFWKVKFLHRHLPEWMRVGVRKRKMGFVYDETQSAIFGEANTEKFGIGGRATLALFDEFGTFDRGEEIYARTADTSHCRVFVGTHRNTQSFFHTLCFHEKFSLMEEVVTHWSQHPEKNKGLYRSMSPVEVLDTTYVYPPDFEFVMDGKPAGGPHPGLRSPWYDYECSRRQDRDVRMDLDIDPIGVSARVFDQLVIARLIRDRAMPPIWVGDLRADPADGHVVDLLARSGGPLALWCRLDKDHRAELADYTIGADLSTGSGASNSCAAVFNANTKEKVGEYTTPFMKQDEFAVIVVALCLIFRNAKGSPAYLAWEMPGGGNFSEKVIEMGFRNFYYKADELKFGTAQRRDRPGWFQNPEAKVLLLEDYRSALCNGDFINRSEPALKECLRFEYTKGGKKIEHVEENSEDPSGAGFNHGDRVIADALAYRMGKGKSMAQKMVTGQDIPYGSLAWLLKRDENKRKRSQAWA